MSLSPRIQPSTWRPQPEPGWNLGFPYTRVPEAGAQWTAVYVALRRELAAHALLDRPMGPWMQRQAANLRRARENRARRGIPEDRCSAPARTWHTACGRVVTTLPARIRPRWKGR